MDLSFCMNLNQTDQLPTLLTRAPTLSHPEDGVITCEFQYSSPEDLLSIETIETISLSQKTELEACCLGDPHAKASRFHRTEDGWSGRFSLREASSLKLPENGRPSMLSSFEESGLLALCGGEVSCVSHFEIAAKSQK